MTKRPTVAIIGAGFSGLLTALRLLMTSDGPNVRLIERRGAFARGAAYSTLDAEHLLNVRASNMSAFPESPSHFVDWLAEEDAPGDHGPFVRRHRYGDYLQAMIQQAMETAPAGRLLLEPDAAVAVELAGAGWRVTLAMGRSFAADAVVLSVGNLPPGAPPGFSIGAASTSGYIADPWSLDTQDLPDAGEALLIGTGLTMVDVALHLARLRPGIRMSALSRRGLLPRRHLAEGPHPLPRPAPPGSTSAVALLRDLRRELQGQEEWRAVFDGLRPHVHAIWRGWPLAERQRFLRHARPWWDVHRHRLAPQVAAKLDHLLAEGHLRVNAGKIQSIVKAGNTFDVVWRPRGGRVNRRLTAAVVVNCAGPNGDLEGCGDPLLKQMFDGALVTLDPCKLGLHVHPDGGVIAANGEAHNTLFAVGPIARGEMWEITSVPDIRIQAAVCADALTKKLNPQAVLPATFRR